MAGSGKLLTLPNSNCHLPPVRVRTRSWAYTDKNRRCPSSWLACPHDESVRRWYLVLVLRHLKLDTAKKMCQVGRIPWSDHLATAPFIESMISLGLGKKTVDRRCDQGTAFHHTIAKCQDIHDDSRLRCLPRHVRESSVVA